MDELAAVPQFAEHAAELKAKGALFCDCAACTIAADLLSKKEYLAKKSVWIFGGDGWAYDIGYGGLDHVIASRRGREHLRVRYRGVLQHRRTGLQGLQHRSGRPSLPPPARTVKKKSLAEIAMQYGYVYVAQVAMGANPAQTIKAITEAEAYHGPSLIIGYTPLRDALHQGRHDELPGGDEEGRGLRLLEPVPLQPGCSGRPASFSMDSKAPAGGYQEFLMNEARYSRLTREFPERAGVLLPAQRGRGQEPL